MIGAGGVGLSGVHIAPAVVPARLIVADVDPEKRAVARQAGAFETIDNGAPDAVKKVLELTGGGVKAAIDFVGAPATARFGMDVLRKGGTLVVVGLYGGALSVPLPLLPQRSLSLRGSYVGTLDEMHEVMALGRAGKVPRSRSTSGRSTPRPRRFATSAPAACAAAWSCGRRPDPVGRAVAGAAGTGAVDAPRRVRIASGPGGRPSRAGRPPGRSARRPGARGCRCRRGRSRG